MTDKFNRRQHEVAQRELAEAEANKAQLALDRWWQAQRDLAAEERRIRRQLDPYNLGLYD